MRPIGDIRFWHVPSAIIAAAAVHVLGITLYLHAMPTRSTPTPPSVLVLSAPPPPRPTPPEVTQQLPAVPLTTPKAPTPPPEPIDLVPDLPMVPIPKVEEPPVPTEPEPEPAKPAPVETAKAVPVPQRKPAPPKRPVATVAPPTPAPAASAAPASSASSATTAATGTRTIADLTPAEKEEMLTEFYVNRKENWLPSFTSPLHARAWLDLGFIDRKGIEDRPEVYADGLNQFMDVHGPLPGAVDPDAPLTIQEKEGILGNGFYDETGPLTVQEVDADLTKLIALGTERFIGRAVKSIRKLTARERGALIEQLYKDDPRWEHGIVDPNADPDLVGMCFGDGYEHLLPTGHELDFCEIAPLTVYEVEATLKKMLREQQGAGGGERDASSTYEGGSADP